MSNLLKNKLQTSLAKTASDKRGSVAYSTLPRHAVFKDLLHIKPEKNHISVFYHVLFTL